MDKIFKSESIIRVSSELTVIIDSNLGIFDKCWILDKYNNENSVWQVTGHIKPLDYGHVIVATFGREQLVGVPALNINTLVQGNIFEEFAKWRDSYATKLDTKKERWLTNSTNNTLSSDQLFSIYIQIPNIIDEIGLKYICKHEKHNKLCQYCDSNGVCSQKQEDFVLWANNRDTNYITPVSILMKPLKG